MMKQKALGKCGLTVGEVGLGCEHLQDKPLSVVRDVVDAAIDAGMNIFDVFMSEPEVRTNLGIALKGKRDKVMLQGHIGAAWIDGQYSRTREPEHYRRFFEDLLRRLDTDYMDIGMLHFVDTQADYENVMSSGMLSYAVELKKKGIIRAVGVSSHDTLVARQLVETGQIDVLMFSLNPAFDLLPADTDLDSLFKRETFAALPTLTMEPARQQLYQACEAMGVGITVMKALGGGALLRAETSPYGAAMSVAQCIHYALTRPAVASVLVGCKTPAEVEAAAAYEQADEGMRDFTPVLSGATNFSLKGRCMYCNHCLPCPARIDIAQVNKYLDLASLSASVPDTVRAHYGALQSKAADCLQCGDCEARCPFDVPVIERMEKARGIFGA